MERLCVKLYSCHANQNFYRTLRTLVNRSTSINSCRANSITKTRTRTICHTLVKYNNQREAKPLDTILYCAMIGSVVLGTSLMSYIGYDMYKRRKLQGKGIKTIHKTESGGMKLFEYKNFVLPQMACNAMNEVKDFDTSEEDVWVVSYPRSGQNLFCL